MKLEHVEPGLLAELAEGALPGGEADEVREHLAECRSCMAAYVDAVRYRAAWLAEPQAFEPDPRILRLARAADPARADARPSRWRGVAALAAAAVIVAFGAWLRPTATSLGFALPPATQEVTEASSSSGLVLPGGERAADRLPPAIRSGRAAYSSQLGREVDAAIREYEHGPRTAAAGARVVAALLASGDLTGAREYADEVLKRNPDHVPTLVFAADVRYRSNDLIGSEGLLRRASQRAPRDPVVGLDLAMVLQQQGRGGEAEAWFERAERGKVREVASRARRERDAGR